MIEIGTYKATAIAAEFGDNGKGMPVARVKLAGAFGSIYWEGDLVGKYAPRCFAALDSMGLPAKKIADVSNRAAASRAIVNAAIEIQIDVEHQHYIDKTSGEKKSFAKAIIRSVDPLGDWGDFSKSEIAATKGGDDVPF